MTDMREPVINLEDCAAAAKLLDRYYQRCGQPSVTLMLSSVTRRPVLCFFERVNGESVTTYYENNPYNEVNGYDHITVGRFVKGLERLEELIHEQHEPACDSCAG